MKKKVHVLLVLFFVVLFCSSGNGESITFQFQCWTSTTHWNIVNTFFPNAKKKKTTTKKKKKVNKKKKKRKKKRKIKPVKKRKSRAKHGIR